jgi:hypothetical protein
LNISFARLSSGSGACSVRNGIQRPAYPDRFHVRDWPLVSYPVSRNWTLNAVTPSGSMAQCLSSPHGSTSFSYSLILVGSSPKASFWFYLGLTVRPHNGPNVLWGDETTSFRMKSRAGSTLEKVSFDGPNGSLTAAVARLRGREIERPSLKRWDCLALWGKHVIPRAAFTSLSSIRPDPSLAHPSAFPYLITLTLTQRLSPFLARSLPCRSCLKYCWNYPCK